jgi:hypothetical protein
MSDTTAANLLVFLFWWVVVDFTWFAILWPNFLIDLNCAAVNLRRKLRKLERTPAGTEYAAPLRVLQDSIDTLIACQDSFNIFSVLAAIHRAKKNDELRERAAELVRILDDCPDAEFKAIREESLRNAMKNLLVYSGAYAVCVVPLIVVVLAFRPLERRLKKAMAIFTLEFKANPGRTRVAIWDTRRIWDARRQPRRN